MYASVYAGCHVWVLLRRRQLPFLDMRGSPQHSFGSRIHTTQCIFMKFGTGSHSVPVVLSDTEANLPLWWFGTDGAACGGGPSYTQSSVQYNGTSYHSTCLQCAKVLANRHDWCGVPVRHLGKVPRAAGPNHGPSCERGKEPSSVRHAQTVRNRTIEH